MEKEELLKELERLRQENASLKEKNDVLVVESQKKDQKLYELNVKLDKALLLISSYQV